jgi:hypothetical protein
MHYDAFISHASEDKDTFVRPLAEQLRKRGHRIWFDEFSLSVGDSLRRSLDKGLRDSRYGIVVLSEDFFKKKWTNYELDGLVQLNIDNPGRLLPIWHGVGQKEVIKFSPPLADIYAVSSRIGTPKDVAAILDGVIGRIVHTTQDGEQITLLDVPSSPAKGEQELGFHTLLRSETERLLNKSDAIIRIENIIVPLRDDFACFEFKHWQDAGGSLKFVRSDLANANTGALIPHNITTRCKTEHELNLACAFEPQGRFPLKLTLEISAANYFPCLFSLGTGYTQYDILYPIDHFIYEFNCPNKQMFQSLKVSANGKPLDRIEDIAQLTWLAKFEGVRPRQPLKITINNSAIL